MTKKLSSKEHAISIPESFLLTIAVHGNLGDGELPRFMQVWAEDYCKELGLTADLLSLKNEKYEELRKRVSNIFGSDTVANIERVAGLAGPVISDALRKVKRD